MTEQNTAEIRASTDQIKSDSTMHISGYAVVFNKPSLPMPFIETIAPTAFDGVDLSTGMLIYDHDFSNILAREDSGTLKLNVDKVGLHFDADLPDTQLGHDTFTNIQNGNLKGLSFGFFVAENGDEWLTKDDVTYHVINQIERLNEISITALPSYGDTSVQVSDQTKRSYEAFMKGATPMADKPTDPQEPKDPEDPQQPENKTTEKPTATGTSASAKPKDDPEPSAKPDQQATAPSKSEDLLNTVIEKLDEIGGKLATPPADPKPNEGENTDMAKNLTENNKNDEETRSFVDYIKTHGQTRAAVVTADNEAVIPTQILTEVKEAVDPNDLYQHVTRITVSAPKGTLPIIKRSGAGLVTKQEAKDNPELSMSIQGVDYSVATYAGMLPISQEMIDDSAVDISSIAGTYVNDVTRLTEQRLIGAVLASSEKSRDVSGVDDLKTAYNKDIPAGYIKTFVLSQSAYDIVDHYKDANGRYLLQDSIANGSGKSLLSGNVIVVEDKVLQKDDKDTAVHGWVGDLKSFVLDAVKKEATVKWQDNDLYSQKLATYLRLNVVKAIEEAGELLNFVEPVAGTETASTATTPTDTSTGTAAK